MYKLRRFLWALGFCDSMYWKHWDFESRWKEYPQRSRYFHGVGVVKVGLNNKFIADRTPSIGEY